MRVSEFGAAVFAAGAIAACNGGSSGIDDTPSLPPNFSLEAIASAVDGDRSVECFINYLAELGGETARTPSRVDYVGVMGGEAGRTVLADDGSGLALIGDAFSQISVVLLLPDHVTITAINLPPSVPHDPPNFWEQILVFEGTLLPGGGITGNWICAPFFTDRGGFDDDRIFAQGSWLASP